VCAYARLVTLRAGLVAMEESVEHKKTVVGLFANLVLLIYYAAPLTTVKEVILTRNSKSLYLPLAVANTVNGTAWFVYGVALSDPYLMAPNGVGALLGALQLVLIFAFPSKHDTSPPPSLGSTQDLLAFSGDHGAGGGVGVDSPRSGGRV
jgi:hypothetical protein